MNLPRKPAAVVFDMGGLLFNSESLYEEVCLLAAWARRAPKQLQQM